MELHKSPPRGPLIQQHGAVGTRECQCQLAADNCTNVVSQLNLLKTLVLWSLNQSEVVNATIKEAYKSRSTKDKSDMNIPLSVQPWGRDGDKRRYWLIEGQDDTAFRVYRESNPLAKNVTWWSVAGSIDELRELAKKLEEEDGTKEAKVLSERMLNAIPRFEATEVVMHAGDLFLYCH